MNLKHNYPTLDTWLTNSIEARLKFFKNEKTVVAESFGFTRKTLYNHMRRFNLLDKYRQRDYTARKRRT